MDKQHEIKRLRDKYLNIAALVEVQINMLDPEHTPIQLVNRRRAALEQIEELTAQLEKLQKGGS